MQLLRRLPEESLRQAAASLGLCDGAPATPQTIRLRDVRYGHPHALQPIFGFTLLNLDAVPGLVNPQKIVGRGEAHRVG